MKHSDLLNGQFTGEEVKIFSGKPWERVVSSSTIFLSPPLSIDGGGAVSGLADTEASHRS